MSGADHSAQAHHPILSWLGKRGLSLRAPLPWGSRIGLLVAAALVFLVACGDPPPPLEPVAAEGAPRVARMDPGSVRPAGALEVTLTGEGFEPGMVVWVGERLVSEVEVADDGKSLRFQAPAAPAGSALDLGVGRVDARERVLSRGVLREGYRTGGLGSGSVAFIAVLLAALALLGTPLYVVIAAVACLGLYLEVQTKADLGFFLSGEDPGAGTNLFTSWLVPMGESPLFIAIPLFTFAGTLMSESNAPTRLINLCRAVLGWLPGGLALVTLVACCFFTAFTGASGVTIVALGGLLFPILLREKYPERFSLGLLTTGGSLGLLFPPSLPVIVYGLVARVDVGRLFQAALVPGILLVLFLAVTSFAVAITSKVPRHPFTWGELKTSLRAGLWELPLPFLVVGGIYSGIITAAEASAVTAAYVLLTTVVIYRDVGPKDLPEVVRKTAVLVGAILLIMGAALGFTDWLTLERIPQKILAAMQRHISGQLTFLITLNIFLLIVGCLMDIFSATLVVVPLIGPVAQEFGVDPYHLAVIFLVNLEIGYSTPPVGINLFIASLRFRRPVFALYRASVLFIMVLLVALMLITYVPALSLGFFDGLPSVQLRAPLGVELRSDGVTLKRVHEGSWAAGAGLKRGDKLLSLGGAELRKRDLYESFDGAAGKQALVIERGGAAQTLEVDLDARAPGESLTLPQGQASRLAAHLRLGDSTLAAATAERGAALAALRALEEEREVYYDELDAAVKRAEDALNTAKDAAAREQARAELKEARAAREPLRPAAERFERARRAVDDLATLGRTLRWRLRGEESESIGPALDLSALPPGTHRISATAIDKRRHVAQAVVTLTITAQGEAPTPSEDPQPTPSAGDDDDDDGAWGDDDDDDDDGAWGDDDDDDGSWGDDDDDDTPEQKSSDDDGSWGDDDDDGSWGDDDDAPEQKNSD